jgi:hypothetical protein
MPFMEVTDTLTKQKFTPIEIVAFHRSRHVFLPLTEIQKEDPDLIEIYKFRGEDFNLIAK